MPEHVYGSPYKASKRTLTDTREERDAHYGRLYDYGRGHSVEVFWDLNKEGKRDHMFKVRIRGRGLEDSIELILDSEQVITFLRWA